LIIQYRFKSNVVLARLHVEQLQRNIRQGQLDTRRGLGQWTCHNGVQEQQPQTHHFVTII